MARASQPHSLTVLCCRRQRRGAIAVAVAAVWAAGGGSLPPLLARAAAEDPAEQAQLPELVRTKHRTFSIPFRLPAAKDADAAPQRVMMSVSKDLGGLADVDYFEGSTRAW